jgi:hypothetical protein
LCWSNPVIHSREAPRIGQKRVCFWDMAALHLDFAMAQPIALDDSVPEWVQRPPCQYDGHRNGKFIKGDVTMATNGTAAAWRASLPVPFALAGLCLSLALAGCESGAGLLGGTTPPVSVVEAPAITKTVAVAIAPVLGIPDEAKAKQLVAQVTAGLDKTRFTVVTQPSQPADYTLRGYATAAKDKSASAKLSYFFDVIDKSGNKVNRIAGEEPLPNAPVGKEIWQALTPQVTQAVATKTVQAFAAYVPAAGAAPAVASVAPVVEAVKVAAAPIDGAVATRAGGPATGSIEKAAVQAVVPSVTGAPGDGSTALSSALQKELSKSGIAMTDGAGGQSYKVEGKVAVGPDKEGKQPIKIDWVVKDPRGKKLGTVSQNNEIPQGSLDGAWGKTADAAAAAAAQGILKVIKDDAKATP